MIQAMEYHVDHHGIVREWPADMGSPVQCSFCGHIYDLQMVEVTARYADCSMWKCPGCDRQVDDRPWVRGIVRLKPQGVR